MMPNNNSNGYNQEYEIDLKAIFKLLVNSKILIITITLVITILGAIYAYQKVPQYRSTALIEIGNYYDNNKEVLIEPTETLIQELTINFIHKQRVNVSINSMIDEDERIEDVNRLIQISSSSTSSVNNNNLLNEIIEYIENRHSNLLSKNIQRITNQLTSKIKLLDVDIEFINNTLLAKNEDEKLRISNRIESLSNQIEFINKTLLVKNEDEKLRISNRIEILNNQLPSLNSKIESLNERIVADQANLLLLKSHPDLFIQSAAQSPTLDQVIFSYKINLIDYENDKVTLLSKKVILENQLKLLEIDHLESEKVFQLSQEKDNLEIQLRHTNITKPLERNDIKFLRSFKLSQERDSIELELEFLTKQDQTSTQLVGKVMTNKASTKKELIIFLSFIFGFFLSIAMVLVYNSLKALKEKLV